MDISPQMSATTSAMSPPANLHSTSARTLPTVPLNTRSAAALFREQSVTVVSPRTITRPVPVNESKTVVDGEQLPDGPATAQASSISSRLSSLVSPNHGNIPRPLATGGTRSSRPNQHGDQQQQRRREAWEQYCLENGITPGDEDSFIDEAQSEEFTLTQDSVEEDMDISITISNATLSGETDMDIGMIENKREDDGGTDNVVVSSVNSSFTSNHTVNPPMFLDSRHLSQIPNATSSSFFGSTDSSVLASPHDVHLSSFGNGARPIIPLQEDIPQPRSNMTSATSSASSLASQNSNMGRQEEYRSDINWRTHAISVPLVLAQNLESTADNGVMVETKAKTESDDMEVDQTSPAQIDTERKEESSNQLLASKMVERHILRELILRGSMNNALQFVRMNLPTVLEKNRILYTLLATCRVCEAQKTMSPTNALMLARSSLKPMMWTLTDSHKPLHVTEHEQKVIGGLIEDTMQGFVKPVIETERDIHRRREAVADASNRAFIAGMGGKKVYSDLEYIIMHMGACHEYLREMSDNKGPRFTLDFDNY
eukprot:TRINITY_DN35652_c1_g1_i1.p1 TRINITY_DN35652_c1_g1~~TRINITY_DN35652_c1_g1_i1.p1  ORF type:complete len:554 (+),score=150.59 TRINITY_DN35652_c1_g1_i1:35-1663(+)